MSGKKKAALVAILASIAGLLAFALSSTAVTGASGTYVLKSEHSQSLGNGAVGVDTTQTNGPVVKLRYGLVAAGTNTKTFVQNGIGCGNVSMVWDDSPAGADYRVTKFSTRRNAAAASSIASCE